MATATLGKTARGVRPPKRRVKRTTAELVRKVCAAPDRDPRLNVCGLLAVNGFQKSMAAHGFYGERRHLRPALTELVDALFPRRGGSQAVRLLSLSQARTELGCTEANCFAAAIPAVAAWSEHWVRPPSSFRVSSKNADRVFASLVRHLFVRYEMPAFMDGVWFLRAKREGDRRRDWFVHLGTGRSIRECELPLRMTRKAAHLFPTAPSRLTVDAALRFSQARACGCSEAVARELVATRLGRKFSNEAFWGTVVEWFGRQDGVRAEEVGPLIDFISAQKSRTVLRVDDGVAREVLANPNMSMAKQTLNRLRRGMEEWHRTLANGRAHGGVDATLTWPSCNIRGHVETRDHGWIVRELLSSSELIEEGRTLQHCVASYAASAKAGHCSIWTLERIDRVGGGRVTKHCTIELHGRTVVQARGLENRRPDASEFAAIRRWSTAARLKIAKNVLPA